MTVVRRPLVPLLLCSLAASALGAADWRCGTSRTQERELRLLHELRPQGRFAAAAAHPADVDVGEVAVLFDQGDLVVRRNPFDLDGAAIRLTPDRSGGYAVARVAVPIEPAGTTLALGNDDARPVELGFEFPFFGTGQRVAFVHADGDVTFGAADAGGGAPGLARLTDGAPRIAAFLADLDPERGGEVSVRLEAARLVVLWNGIPGAGQINRNTFQLVLHADGRIDIAWAGMQTREGVVGIAPGRPGAIAAIDWSAAESGAGALAERFSESEYLDLMAATRRFLAGRADVFQQVIVYTTRPLNPAAGTLAFEINVRNDVQGIGVDLMDHSREWGSAGALESVVYMDSADTYADVDAFEILGHEVGHRWLARLRVDGTPDGGLLGRGGAHWSFFLDSDASVMEGNDIADRGNGRFETVDFARGYSALDQYAMGLRTAAEVPPFFYVAVPDDFRPNRAFKSSSAPEAGITFTGERRDVRIEDVVGAMGPRLPALGPPVFRQAFVLVADSPAAATASRVATVARIRSRFGAYFAGATGGRGTALSTLRP
jgi:hypothetical protein